MTNSEFSRILRKVIAESGLSWNEAARRAGIAHSTLLMWANGRVSPKLETAWMVLGMFGYKLEVVAK